ncbi:putative pectinesterase/pectinesterase inhibitor 28 [Acorus calamus]|uniref:Pectinesterase n=1 Tax=Acorus calamus TaxID=4465 RepID=A0AAV9ES99_ACOCL|nr:putative pectinesterase/pectinesterase inhibitor 28 [Acorus calamus]
MQSSRGTYGQVSDQPRPRKNRRIALLGASAVILLVVVVAIAIAVSHDHHSPDSSSSAPSTSVKSIQAICQPTDYKVTCENSLTSVAGSNTTNPNDLVKLAFQVTVDRIHDAANHSSVLQSLKHDPRTAQALENCNELMEYAVDDLKESIEKLGGFDLSKLDKLVEDLNVWLSASITYQETCLDGFENTTGDAGESMRKAMKTGMELSSNALAIVGGLSNILGDMNLSFLNRRLLSEEGSEFPSWVSLGRRRLLSADANGTDPDVVVAKDGTGQYETINDALAAVPKNGNKTFVVYIKEGVYKEYVQINRSMTNVMFIGDGPTKTKITGNKNFIDGTPTFKTATVAVVGDGFIAKDIGFENSAGPEKHQAVALRVQSDMSVFYNCQMDGYQDTLYAHTNRQFYRDCVISGTVDFIFGNSPVVFQNCKIVVRKPLDNQQNTITAQGRKDRREPTALILHNCTIVADPEYYPVRKKLPTYLGRPWKEYSRTFVMQSQIDDLVRPEGWQPWFGDFALNTCFYAEFDNRGPGAGVTGRVKWRGVKTISWEHAQKFTVEHFIQGTRWLPVTNVPYIPGLLPVSSYRPDDF